MGDLYQEILISRKTPFVNKIIKGVAYVATALFLLIGMLFLNPLYFIPGIALGACCYFLVPKLDLEYEYLYVNGELDIDAIYSKQKRKRIASYDMADLEILAPSTSHALDSYLNQGGVKVRDFTSKDPQVQTHTLVFSKEGKREIIMVELDDVILNDIRRIAPRKVNTF